LAGKQYSLTNIFVQKKILLKMIQNLSCAKLCAFF